MNKGVIAVCIVRMDESVQVDSIRAITQRAEEQGLYVEIYNSFVDLQKHDLHDKGEESVYDIIDYKHLCGIILFPEKIKNEAINQKIINYGKANNIPVVSIDRYIPECISVTFDCTNAMGEIVDHLIKVHNCQKFWIMAGIKGNVFSEDRIDAAKKVFAKNGIDFSDDDIEYGDFWETPARAAFRRMLDRNDMLPDAIVALNDAMAMTICDELSARGYSVPGDVIVTGFDGIEMEKYAVPRLTTATTDIEKGAYLAVDAIVSANRGNRDVMNHYEIPFYTRFSQSCGCEPIAFAGVNSKLTELYQQTTKHRNIYAFMHNLLVGMTSHNNLIDMMQEMDAALDVLANYTEMYICLRRDEVDIDVELMKKVEWLGGVRESDEARNPMDRQMVLLWEYHKGETPTIPLKVFRMREQIPYRESVLDEAKNILYLPLHSQDKVFGYLVVGMLPQNNRYEYYDLSYLATSLSQSIATVIQTQRLSSVNDKLTKANDKLEVLYITDPLTEVNNRRGFYREIDRKRNREKYHYVMMVSVDLDGLKYINDNFGHIAGDKAICAMANILKDMTDDNSVCARFGGDEYAFCRLYKEYDAADEKRFKAELAQRIEEYNAGVEDAFSVGASTGTEMSEIVPGIKLDELLKKADAKMYAEKERHHKARR